MRRKNLKFEIFFSGNPTITILNRNGIWKTFVGIDSPNGVHVELPRQDQLVITNNKGACRIDFVMELDDPTPPLLNIKVTGASSGNEINKFVVLGAEFKDHDSGVFTFLGI